MLLLFAYLAMQCHYIISYACALCQRKIKAETAESGNCRDLALSEGVSLTCRWCTMKIGALAATAANVLLLTFFIFQSFQSPFGRKGQDGALVDMQRQAMMAAEEHFKLGSPSAESHFKPWIKKDLATWAQQGIAIVSFPCLLLFSKELP